MPKITINLEPDVAEFIASIKISKQTKIELLSIIFNTTIRQSKGQLEQLKVRVERVAELENAIVSPVNSKMMN